MKKVVFFGSIGLARKCLKEIVLEKEVELLGVCCSPLATTWRDEESVYSFCIKNKIPVLTFGDIENMSPDIGFSVRYDKIIPESIINLFKQGIFNTHGGILPEYRGSYCNINALINKEEEYGVTLHYLSKGVDAGDIVAIKKVKIEESDTGFSLYKKSEKLCFDILKENIDSIINDSNNRIIQSYLIEQGHKCVTYYAKSTLEKKFISSDSLEQSINIIKAFDSPHHEPAYTFINNEKVYLRTSFGETVK